MCLHHVHAHRNLFEVVQRTSLVQHFERCRYLADIVQECRNTHGDGILLGHELECEFFRNFGNPKGVAARVRTPQIQQSSDQLRGRFELAAGDPDFTVEVIRSGMFLKASMKSL